MDGPRTFDRRDENNYSDTDNDCENEKEERLQFIAVKHYVVLRY
jgi:hypothetical protein